MKTGPNTPARRRLALAAILAAASWLAVSPAAHGQVRPAYIGFVYPAGGRQGTTFQIKLGGQGLEGVNAVLVTGSGVTATALEYDRPLDPQEQTLLREQLRDLKRGATATTSPATNAPVPLMAAATAPDQTNAAATDPAAAKRMTRIEKRLAECVNRPASVALAGIVYAQVTIAPDAAPGRRELRLCTPRGISNPLVFLVGQVPEFTRRPMITASLQVLGKEELALRKRPPAEVEDTVTLPCTLNGQVASGEVNRYRFAARRGQRLVIATQARQLIPFIADAVPGWFQPLLALYDARGKEVAYDDDNRFDPDPSIFYQVPESGDYVLVIYDALYRGREDFVYRVTLGELPFVTSLFPLGAPAGAPAAIRVKGWNLGASQLTVPAPQAGPGVYPITATNGGLVSNPLPFALDTLPECLEEEPNDTPAQAQQVTLPIIINGRIEPPGDWDLFQFAGKSNQTVVAEVYARRLESPLDSILKLTDASGRLLAFNDDHEDLGDGLHTHHADSWLMARLPADGNYYVHLGDTAGHGGQAYGYRLRISAPQPDFALRVVPSSVTLRGRSAAPVSVYALRKDGFEGPIKLALQDPPPGFSTPPLTISGTQTVARLMIRTSLAATAEPLSLSIAGSATIQGRTVTHEAVPAEDRMQAFLWRHLVPAAEFKALVFNPLAQPALTRLARARPPAETEAKPMPASTNSTPAKPAFTKQQVAARLRQLKLLFEEGLLTDEFYDQKAAECDAAQ